MISFLFSKLTYILHCKIHISSVRASADQAGAKKDATDYSSLVQIPLWYEVKLLFVAWLVRPQFRGASSIYDRFVREQVRKHGVRGCTTATATPPITPSALSLKAG